MMTKRVLDSNDSEHLRKLSDPSTEYALHGGAA